jgi:type III secretion protein, YscU/HrpY family
VSDEKTEEPTGKKLRDARKKGQAAQSKDVSSTASLAAMYVYFFTQWGSIQQQLVKLVGAPAIFYDQPFAAACSGVLGLCGQVLVSICMPVVLIPVVVGVAANFFQVGPMLALETVKPDPSKLNPIEKLKQMFSMKNLMELAKSTAKVILLTWVIWRVIANSMEAMVRSPLLGLEGVIAVFKAVMTSMGQWVLGAYILMAAIDWWFQRRQFKKQLMMSKDEVKREYKESEGDPHVKGHRKQMHKEMVMGDAPAKTKKATVLVTNPTHKAVALYYEPGETKLPMILAKGEGFVAQRMIEAAEEAGVPIMRNIPLARALFAEGKVDDYIPAEFIEPVAEVLKWVAQLKREKEI